MMFALDDTILLVCVWIRDMMRDPSLCKEAIEFLILTTPVHLHGHDFSVKGSFNEILEAMKDLKDLRFMPNQIYPSVFAKIIDTTAIVVFPSNQNWSRPSNIQMDKF
jgi:hypothetical protein